MSDLNALRAKLFDTMDAVTREEKPLDLDRAKAVVDIAGKLIETAKVEVDFLRVTGHTQSSGFIPALPNPATDKPGTPDQPRLVKGSAASGSR